MMRRIVASAVLILCATVAMAGDSPVDAGSWMVGGAAFFRSESGDRYTVPGFDDPVLTVSLRPSASAFISKGLSIGFEVAYERSLRNGQVSWSRSWGPHVGVYAPLTKYDAEKAVNPFIYSQAFFNRGTGENNELYYESEYNAWRTIKTETNLVAFGGQAGILMTVTGNVALDWSLRVARESDDGIAGTVLEAGVGLAIVLW